MNVIFLCSSPDALRQVERRNASLGNSARFLLRNQLNSDLLREMIGDDPSRELLCLVREDVILPRKFLQNLRKLQVELDEEWPNWGLVGESGVSPLGYGMAASKVVRYASDRKTGINLGGHIVPTYSQSGAIQVLNLRRIRDGKFELELSLDPLGVTLPLQVIQHGLAVLTAPHLSCFVDVDRLIENEAVLVPDPSLKDFLVTRVENLFFKTCHGEIDLSGESDRERGSKRVDASIACLRNAQKGRAQRSLEIVTRTTNSRPRELERTALTVSVLKTLCPDLRIRHTVISGVPQLVDTSLPQEVRFVVKKSEKKDLSDDRFELIQEAAQSSEADYLWFIDDDDWVFPQSAEMLSLSLNNSPLGSTFYFDSQQFTQNAAESRPESDGYAPLSPGERVLGKNFALNIGGLNHVPFSSVVFNRNSVLNIPRELLSDLYLYEDFALQLCVMSDSSYFPVSADCLVAGIQFRRVESGAKEPRKEWNEAMASLSSFFAQKTKQTVFFSLPEAGESWHGVKRQDGRWTSFHELEALDQAVVDLTRRKTEVEQLTIEIEELRRELEDQVSLLESSTLVHESVKESLRRMEESRSWRFTSPARRLLQAWSRLRVRLFK